MALSDDQITQIRERLGSGNCGYAYLNNVARDLLALVDRLRSEQCPREHANLEGLIQRIGIGGFAGPVPDDGQDVALLAHIIHGESQRANNAEASLARLRTALEGLPAWLNRLATEMDQVEDTANLFMQELSGLRVWADKIEAALASTRPDASSATE